MRFLNEYGAASDHIQYRKEDIFNIVESSLTLTKRVENVLACNRGVIPLVFLYSLVLISPIFFNLGG